MTQDVSESSSGLPALQDGPLWSMRAAQNSASQFALLASSQAP
jgi:hypothetical protein